MITCPTSHFELLFTSVSFKTSAGAQMQLRGQLNLICKRLNVQENLNPYDRFCTKTRSEEEVKATLTEKSKFEEKCRSEGIG